LQEDERKKLIDSIALAMEALTPSQLELVRNVIARLATKTVGYRNPESDFVSEAGLNHIGDALLAHHSMAQRPLSKESFEHALEGALRRASHDATLAKRGNPGHDITVDGVPISLKTQANAGIKADVLHISKFMELGSGTWKLPLLRDQFLHHMRNYERIFQFRCHRQAGGGYLYELVEIPMALLQEGEHAVLELRDKSTQDPKPGYGYVRDKAGRLKFSLYFDGGTERKLQIKDLRKELCIVHATWSFDSTALT
jgi:Type II site-specific deoxyribonuclease